MTWFADFQRGDLHAFAQLIEDYRAHVYAVAVAVVIDRALAEDVAQETFLAAHARRHQLRDPDAVGSWLAAIARNRGRDLLRKRAREVPLAVEPVAPARVDPVLRDELRAELDRTLARIPLRYREVLILHYAHGHTAERIARDLGLSRAATLQRLARGRGLIRRRATALREYLELRPARDIAIAVLAIVAARTARADARCSSSTLRRRLAAGGALGIALTAVTLLGWSGDRIAAYAADDEPVASPRAASTTHLVASTTDEPGTSMRAAPTPHAAQHIAASTTHAAPRVLFATPAASTRAAQTAQHVVRGAIVEPDFDRATADAHVRKATRIARGEIVEPDVGATATCPPAEPRSAPGANDGWYPINALLESAAMLRSGEVRFEFQGPAMYVRGGIGEHVAIHAGVVPLDYSYGKGQGGNIDPGFGGGVKIGGRHGALGAAVIVEGARQVGLKAMKLGDAWTGRAYTAVTIGRERSTLTLIAGVMTYDDAVVRQTAPLLGVASQLAYDDRVGLVFEYQHVALGQTRSTWVGALRGRWHRGPADSNWLGISDVRIDLGVIDLENANDSQLGPWLQTGIGW